MWNVVTYAHEEIASVSLFPRLESHSVLVQLSANGDFGNELGKMLTFLLLMSNLLNVYDFRLKLLIFFQSMYAMGINKHLGKKPLLANNFTWD